MLNNILSKYKEFEESIEKNLKKDEVTNATEASAEVKTELNSKEEVNVAAPVPTVAKADSDKNIEPVPVVEKKDTGTDAPVTAEQTEKSEERANSPNLSQLEEELKELRLFKQEKLTKFKLLFQKNTKVTNELKDELETAKLHLKEKEREVEILRNECSDLKAKFSSLDSEYRQSMLRIVQLERVLEEKEHALTQLRQQLQDLQRISKVTKSTKDAAVNTDKTLKGSDVEVKSPESIKSMELARIDHHDVLPSSHIKMNDVDIPASIQTFDLNKTSEEIIPTMPSPQALSYTYSNAGNSTPRDSIALSSLREQELLQQIRLLQDQLSDTQSTLTLLQQQQIVLKEELRRMDDLQKSKETIDYEYLRRIIYRVVINGASNELIMVLKEMLKFNDQEFETMSRSVNGRGFGFGGGSSASGGGFQGFLF